jgi:hypothetical protein
MKARTGMLEACVARFQSVMEPLDEHDRHLMMNALEDLNHVLCEEGACEKCAEPSTADTHGVSCKMTPESKQIVEVVDGFNEAERACMRDAILDIASLCRSARAVRGKKKPAAQRKPAGNLIVVDFGGRCS